MTPDEMKALLKQAGETIDRQEAENAALNLDLARAQAAQREAEAAAADEAAARDALAAEHAEALKKIAANEETRKLPSVPSPAQAPTAPKIAAPASPALPSKPGAPRGRNGVPIVSRHYLGAFLLAVLLGFSLMGCAGTSAGNWLDGAAGVVRHNNADGSVTYEKLPSSPIQDGGGLFGPIGVAVGGLIAGGIYAVRQLGNSVPAKTHDALIASQADPVSSVTTTHTGPAAGAPTA